ncbi:MAG: hypothetical protein R6U98_04725, partial [Pirellulaceae bacterium]
MQDDTTTLENSLFLARSALDDLIQLLRRQGYGVLGPTVVNETVMIRPLQSVDELPSGVRDDQDGGSYRLDEGDPHLTF